MAFPRSGTVDTSTYSGTKDFVFAHAGAVQSANVAANDHLKLDTVDVSRGAAGSGAGAAGGGSVFLDTTTTYSNSNGAASLGRFTLQGGKIYKLSLASVYALFSGATGVLDLQWFDVTGTPAAIGTILRVLPVTQTSNDNATGNLETMFAPGGAAADTKLVEVRIITATALTSIGDPVKGAPTALVETY